MVFIRIMRRQSSGKETCYAYSHKMHDPVLDP